MNVKEFSYKNALTSARKAGLLAPMIQGQDVSSALIFLEFTNKKTSLFWQKLLKSAVGYFEGSDPKELVITSAYTGRGNMVNLKRGRPSGRSHYWPYKKYRAHLYVVITKREEVVQEVKKAKKNVKNKK